MNWSLFYQLNAATISFYGLVGFYVAFTMMTMLIIKLFLQDLKTNQD
jgi:hypothetical protein